MLKAGQREASGVLVQNRDAVASGQLMENGKGVATCPTCAGAGEIEAMRVEDGRAVVYVVPCDTCQGAGVLDDRGASKIRATMGENGVTR